MMYPVLVYWKLKEVQGRHWKPIDVSVISYKRLQENRNI